MRAIRIIKQKQNANEATTESKKPDEPSTRKIANTVKSWIEESQQHRRNLPRSLSALGVLILIASTVAMGQSPDIKVTKYELTIQPSFAGCDGPMVESNKISFEVVN